MKHQCHGPLAATSPAGSFSTLKKARRLSLSLLLALLLTPAGWIAVPLAQSNQALWVKEVPLTGCLRLGASGKDCLEPVRLHPAPISQEALETRLGPEHSIPRPGKEQLEYTTGIMFKKEVKTVDLARKVPEWLALRFDDPSYGNPEHWTLSVGNILNAFEKIRGNRKAQKELLRQLETRHPRIWEKTHGFLPAWVLDDLLYSDRWDPRRTEHPEGAGNDGILERPPFLCVLPDTGETRKVYQASAPIYASLEDIQAAESDFQHYPYQKGSNYLEVFPLDDSFFAGRDKSGMPFLVYDVSFHQKPLPLWNLHFVIRQSLHCQEGRWLLDNHLLEGDMNFLRLRIFYDPIVTTQGNVIGHVKTEWLDVDVRGLPDRETDRMAGARGDVGNIKLMAEKIFNMP